MIVQISIRVLDSNSRFSTSAQRSVAAEQTEKHNDDHYQTGGARLGLLPLALGDIQPQGFRLIIDRVGTLVDNASSEHYEGGEVSFSRYAQARARGDTTARPAALSDAWLSPALHHHHHRQPAHHASPAERQRIGVTGWQDSGNTGRAPCCVKRASISTTPSGLPDA